MIGLTAGQQPCRAQVATAAATTERAGDDVRSIEDLNLLGAAVTMPSFSDNLVPVDSRFRQALFGEGTMLRGIQFVPGSFEDVFCLAANNDASQTTAAYVWDDRTPCRVVGHQPE